MCAHTQRATKGGCVAAPPRKSMELSQQYGVQTVAVASHKNGTAKVVAAQGSVVDFTGTAIVNAANEGCLGGGGVDGAISNAGGDALYQARCELPVINAGRRGAIRCHTGDAKTTIAGDLPCKFVIHAVGPAYNYVSDYDEGGRLLYMAYRKSMCEARRMSMDTLAFSLLSAGIFRGDRPLRHVLSIAVLAVYAAVYDQLKQVFFVAFTREEVDTLSSVIHGAYRNACTASTCVVTCFAKAFWLDSRCVQTSSSMRRRASRTCAILSHS